MKLGHSDLSKCNKTKNIHNNELQEKILSDAMNCTFNLL